MIRRHNILTCDKYCNMGSTSGGQDLDQDPRPMGGEMLALASSHLSILAALAGVGRAGTPD